MKRIYLDQRIWIDLTKAAKGRPDGEEFRDALDVLRYGTQQGLISLPLSPSHYMELKHGTSGRQRREVGELMLELSRGDRMLNSGPAMRAAEIDAALHKRFGLPREPRTVQIFGKGMAHAFSRPPIRGQIVAKDPSKPLGVDPLEKQRLEEMANDMFERWTLMGPPEDVDTSGSGYDPVAHRVVEDEWLAGEEELAKLFTDPQLMGQPADILYGRAIVALHKELYEACIRAGLPPETVAVPDEAFLKGFLEDLPAEYAVVELRRLQFQNPGRPWKKTDMYDLRALPVAVVHCEVVVAENHWAHMIRRAKLDKRHGTTVLTDAKEIPKHIV